MIVNEVFARASLVSVSTRACVSICDVVHFLPSAVTPRPWSTVYCSESPPTCVTPGRASLIGLSI